MSRRLDGAERERRRRLGRGMSDALAYHRATDVPAGGSDEDEARMIGTKPSVFKDYADAERLPLETLSAGPVLRDGAGIVRTQDNRDYGGGTIHWRAYSSAGALFPVEAYVAARTGLTSFPERYLRSSAAIRCARSCPRSSRSLSVTASR